MVLVIDTFFFNQLFQGNLVNNGGIDNPSSNRQDSPNKNYTMNPKGGQLRGGYAFSFFGLILFPFFYPKI